MQVHALPGLFLFAPTIQVFVQTKKPTEVYRNFHKFVIDLKAFLHLITSVYDFWCLEVVSTTCTGLICAQSHRPRSLSPRLSLYLPHLVLLFTRYRILLAGLYAEGPFSVLVPSERMRPLQHLSFRQVLLRRNLPIVFAKVLWMLKTLTSATFCISTF